MKPLGRPIICKDGDDAPEGVCCRASLALPATATGEFMYMPGGLQTLTPISGAETDERKQTIPITVRVDAAGAAALNAQHAAIVAKGKRPMFDFNHEDAAASFWPEEYFWRDTPEPGIYCRGEWSARGKAAVDGKEYRQFSPVFHVTKKKGATPQNPAAIVCREWAKPNMGGLVNNPAFHTILPLWAKDGEETDREDIRALTRHVQQLTAEARALLERA